MFAPELLGGRYDLRGVLGRGGMAEVREGFDTYTAQIVAIKLLHPGYDTNPDYQRRFWAEAQAAAALRHPNIVTVYGAGAHHGAPFIVMERLPGLSLADLIGRGPVNPQYVHRVLSDVLAALSVAHEADVLHRDIKPANILLAEDGAACVADFGLAKRSDSGQTETGRIMGTMAYMSPERLSGRPATVTDDVYAVGVLGYEALTGRRAFPETNLAALAHAITTNPPPTMSAVRPDIDSRLAAIIDRAMARDLSKRFRSARQMWAAIADIDGDPVTAPLPRMPSPAVPPTFPECAPGRRASSRVLVLTFLLAFVLALILAGIAFGLGALTPEWLSAEIGSSGRAVVANLDFSPGDSALLAVSAR